MRTTAQAAAGTVAVTAVAALLAAGCGTVRYQGAAGRGDGRTAGATASAARTITTGDAERLARALLSRAPLPAGARWRSGPPVAALSRPPSAQTGSPSVALHGLWTVAEPMASVAAYLSSHAPAGMTVSGSGQVGQAEGLPEPMPRARQKKDGGVQPGNVGTVISEFVTYQLRRPPAGVGIALLSVAVASAGRGASELRADAQVIWYPPRSRAERVPASMRTVTITAYALNPKPRDVTRTFGSATVVRRLAALLNGAPALPRGIIGCPLMPVRYWLAFASSPRAVSGLTASYDGCLGVQVTVHGRAQPALVPPPGLGPLLAGLMHVPGGPLPGGVTPNPGAVACGPLNGPNGDHRPGYLEARDSGTMEIPCVTMRPGAP